MNLYALGQRDALAKYGELHVLTGRSGGGKSTLAKNLEGNYDLILNTDVGKFVNGRWVRPETSEEREKIRKGIHDKIFAAHNEGKKVLLEGVPNGLLKVLGEDANQAKVFMLPTSHQVALRRAEGRAKERGSDVQQDLESVVAENAKFKRTLDDLKARSASFTKLPAGKKITDLAKYGSF